MVPGAVCIWPCGNGEMEVAPIDRISVGSVTLTILFKRGPPLRVLVHPDTADALIEHGDELRFLRFDRVMKR